MNIDCMIAVCKGSYVVYSVDLTEWEMIMIRKINAYQCKLMRITINTLIFIYLCHLALDHRRGKTLFLCDSQLFSLILDDSC